MLEYEEAPRTAVDKHTTDDFVCQNKGVLQLCTTYFQKYGDPRINNLGHTGPFAARWKDGSMQE
eukprot:2494674-Lingulodinium_polyedra.AAC.1